MNPELNTQLLDQALAFTTVDHPEVHDQEVWAAGREDAPPVELPSGEEVCGTAGCVAGWTVLMSKEVRIGLRRVKPLPYCCPECSSNTPDFEYVYLADDDQAPMSPRLGQIPDRVYPRDSVFCDWAYTAQSLLGLTSTEADILFLGTNTRDDLQEIAKDIKNGKYR